MSTRPNRRCKSGRAERTRSLKIESLERRVLLAWSVIDSTPLANDLTSPPISGFVAAGIVEVPSTTFNRDSTDVSLVGPRFKASDSANLNVVSKLETIEGKFENTESFSSKGEIDLNQLTTLVGGGAVAIGADARLLKDSESIVADSIAPRVVSFVTMPTVFPAFGTDHIEFLATFSEAVTGVDAADFAVAGAAGEISVREVSPSTYEITVSGSDLRCNVGSIGLNLASSPTITDLSLNALFNEEPETDIEFGIDEPPRVTSVIASGSLRGATFIDAVDGGGTGAGNGLGYLLTSGLILPNTGIDRIYIQFSEPVIGFNASNFMLMGVVVPNYSAISSVSYDALNMRGIVQLSSSIARDKLRIRVSDAITDLGSNALDGDSNGLAGGVFDFRFNVLLGDASGDGSVNGGDMSFFGDALNSTVGSGVYNSRADWNAGGSVTIDSDISFYIANFNKSLPSTEPSTLDFVP